MFRQSGKTVSQGELNRLKVLYEQQDNPTLVKETRALLKKYPSSITMWNILGAAYKDLEEIDEAIYAFTEYLIAKLMSSKVEVVQNDCLSWLIQLQCCGERKNDFVRVKKSLDNQFAERCFDHISVSDKFLLLIALLSSEHSDLAQALLETQAVQTNLNAGANMETVLQTVESIYKN